jgi:hypothetical protein
VTFTNSVQSGAGKDGALTVTGTGRLGLTVVTRQNNVLELLGNFEGLRLSQEGMPTHRTDYAGALASALQHPFILRFTQDGALATVAYDPNSAGLALGLLKTLVAPLQLVRPETAGDGASAWTVEENDSIGRYQARYERAGDDEIKKTKLRYLTSSLQLGFGKQAESERWNLQSVTRYERGEDGVHRRIQLDESIQVPWEGSQFEVAAKVELQLQDISDVAFNPPNRAGLRVSPLFAPADFVEGPPDQQALEALARGQDYRGLVRELDQLRDPQKVRERTRAMERLSAVFAVQPGSIARALDDLGARRITGNDARRLVSALSSTGTPEAQRALAKVVRDVRLEADTRGAALASLGAQPQPTVETLEELATMAEDPALDPVLKSPAKLALGAAARRGVVSSDAAVGEAAEAAVDSLLDDYSQSTSVRERTLSVHALGNTGSPDVVSALQTALAQASPEVREAAVNALRHIPGDEVDGVVAKVLTQDADDGVRDAAMRVADQREASPALQAAVVSRLEKDSSASVRANAVKWLASNGAAYPGSQDLLAQVARSDASPEVRELAKRLLDPNSAHVPPKAAARTVPAAVPPNGSAVQPARLPTEGNTGADHGPG